jgi:hypothetical protein
LWSAWSAAGLYVLYGAVLFAGGVARGVPREPYLAMAEILTMLGAVLQLTLIATIHECAPRRAKVHTLMAVAWMAVMAGATITVHFVNLTVGRRIDMTDGPGFARLFGWEWPSLLYGVELAAWHIFFGLSLLFAAPAFRGRGKDAVVRGGLRATGALCLLGLVGPAVGNLQWRMIGVFGYGVVFPAVCVVIGLVFEHSPWRPPGSSRPGRARAARPSHAPPMPD